MTGAVQLKQLVSDYTQQKHTTWADNYCSIKTIIARAAPRLSDLLCIRGILRRLGHLLYKKVTLINIIPRNTNRIPSK